MTIDKHTDEGFHDETGVLVMDHLLIKDVETGRVLVNQQGSTKNFDFEDNDEE